MTPLWFSHKSSTGYATSLNVFRSGLFKWGLLRTPNFGFLAWTSRWFEIRTSNNVFCLLRHKVSDLVNLDQLSVCNAYHRMTFWCNALMYWNFVDVTWLITPLKTGHQDKQHSYSNIKNLYSNILKLIKKINYSNFIKKVFEDRPTLQQKFVQNRKML